jgi:hypothetical protein
MTTTSRHAQLLGFAMLIAGCDRDNIEHDSDSRADTGDDESASQPETGEEPPNADDDFPTRMAEGYCAALFACDPLTLCTDTAIPYADQDACVGGEQAALEAVREAAHAEGLAFDAECVDNTIAGYAELACHGANALLHRGVSYYSMCAPYYGDVPLGENPCFDVVNSDLTTCGRNLECRDESCHAVEQSCTCEAGTGCFVDATNQVTCEPLVAIGAACRDEQSHDIGPCPLEAACINDVEEGHLGGTCQLLLDDGVACEGFGVCASGACDEVCVPASPWLCDESAAPRRWR